MELSQLPVCDKIRCMTKSARVPQTDSIEELAKFWATPDVTDFEDELEEVTEPLFGRCGTITVSVEEFESLPRSPQENRLITPFFDTKRF